MGPKLKASMPESGGSDSDDSDAPEGDAGPLLKGTKPVETVEADLAMYKQMCFTLRTVLEKTHEGLEYARRAWSKKRRCDLRGAAKNVPNYW